MRSSTVTPAPQPPVNRYIHLGLTPAQQSIILGGPSSSSRAGTSGQPSSYSSGPSLPEPPLKAISPSVPSGSGGGSTTPTLTWLNGGGATSYDVYFNSAFIGNQATTSYTPDPLSYLTTYTWRVDAVNAGGTTTGDTWSFTTIMGLHTTATVWAANVVTNGGAAPSSGTVTAISNFCYALDSASLTSSFLALNVFAPDSLVAALTPLIHNKGLALWNNSSFVGGDLSVNGLTGDGSTKHLDTGVYGDDWASSSSIGLTAYVQSTPGNTPNWDMGFSDGSVNAFLLYTNDGGSYVAIGPTVNNVLTGASPGAGYYSINRISTTDLRLFYATSTSPHAQLGSTGSTLDAGMMGHNDLYVFAVNLFTSGTPPHGLSTNRFSFVAMHTGFLAAQSAALYNAVQALRIALGGGYI